MSKLVKTLAIASAVSAALAGSAQACSTFFFDTPQDNRIVGRTMESPIKLEEHVFMAPRNYEGFGGVTGSIGYVGIMHGDTDWVSSGLNEHGLNVETLGLGASGNHSKYADIGKGDYNQQNISAYILANAKSVDEAIELVKKVKVENSHLPVAHDIDVGLHLAITDVNRAVVVEWTDGSGYPDIHENKLGVMTNEPAYPLQMEEVAIFLGGEASFENSHVKWSEMNFPAFERTPFGRTKHIVAMNYTNDLSRVKTDYDAVNHAWTMLNTMDVPQGALYWRWLDELPQMVGWANVADLKNTDYYLRTFDNMDIQKIDLDKIDFDKIEFTHRDIYNTKKDYQAIQW
ncbi:linear amide C-N hydrolase [Paraferrimonas sedimenticola]|uniref:Choloylglycine hydrolase n=1 Tax=Paraferrimonas sedimenticola TaxID=375674 RepID=A0AA37RW61_9GAMM|nr:linear amide C-N hydrolase [Paraferrimonas sedimenticola]GLP96301.1 choloylglycine hydrolase [Paraferrimonas sedimenticola]